MSQSLVLRPVVLGSSGKDEKYVYSSLSHKQSVRLVEILPNEPDDEIRCRISSAKLSACGDYEALSYTWGDPSITEDIWCEGRRLSITTNLMAALRRLRYSERPRVFWIDAICVNQEDLDERSEQVRKMAQVFGKAWQVIVWLGEAADDSDPLFDALSKMDSSIYMQELYRYHVHGERTLVKKAFPLIFQDPYLKPALEKLLFRPWFTRVWVLQEVASASSVRVLCGSRDISFDKIVAIQWANFREARANRRGIGFDPEAVFAMDCVHEMQRHRCLPDKVQSVNGFIDVVRRAQRCYATDPRDKIYALLSLASGLSFPSVFCADYTIPVEDLYTNTAQVWLEKGNTLLLEEAGRSRQLNSLLKSWTPDWANQKHLGRMMLKTLNWKASGNTKSACRIQTLDGQKVLVISGISIDTIRVLGGASPSFRWNPYSAEEFKDTQAIYNPLMSMFDLDSCYFNGDPLPVALGRTLTADRRQDISAEISAKFSAWNHYITSGGADIDFDRRLLFRSDLRYQQTFVHRQFALTEKGFMCLVPPGCAEGDTICIIRGYRMPFVLRKKDEYFELIGESYVHGFMYGEAFSDQSSEIGENIDSAIDDVTQSTDINQTVDTKNSPPGEGREISNSLAKQSLPRGWRQRFSWSKAEQQFAHEEMDIFTVDDPRISRRAGPVPSGWTSGFGLSLSNLDDQNPKPFFVNLRTGDTTREDPGAPLLEDGSVLGGFRII